MPDSINIAIPHEIENLQLASPELITFYKNLQERILWLDSDVDDLYLEYGRYIIGWNRDDKDIPPSERRPIKLMFRSDGGSLIINDVICDLIAMSTTPVYGYAMGETSSAAAFIFMSCHKRFAMPKSVFLLHRGSGSFSGSYDEVVSQVIEYQRKIEELAKFIKSHSKITDEMIEENLGTEWFIPADEAVRLGVADQIITDISELL